jgi:tRNA pseudouridine55 synthase
LRREWVSPFQAAPCYTLEELRELTIEERQHRMLPSDAGILHLPATELSAEHAQRYLRGQRIPLGKTSTAGITRVYFEGQLLALGEIDGRGSLHIQRLLISPNYAAHIAASHVVPTALDQDHAAATLAPTTESS